MAHTKAILLPLLNEVRISGVDGITHKLTKMGYDCAPTMYISQCRGVAISQKGILNKNVMRKV